MMRWLGQLQLAEVRRLSEGGHGEVYAAKLVSAEGTSQEVVLKLARGKNRNDLAMSRQFLLQEARLTAAFDHPNIIGFRDYNVVEMDGERVPCLIMDHGGVPLSAVLQSHGGRLEPGLAAFIGVEVLSALAYSHSRDVIHRDVKPQNVLIGSHGQVRLIDYGIAKAADPRNPSTVVTNLKGTPVYISPEAYKGEKLDGRADIWSVGVMLFELVIGRKPWEDDRSEPNEMVRLRRLSDLVMEGPLPDLPAIMVPDELAVVIKKLLMKDRNDRYEDALQAMYALERVACQLVGPWAAARELGQHVLAASNPAVRRREPTVDDSTANVRSEHKDGNDEYVSMVVRAPESGANITIPSGVLCEDGLLEAVAFTGECPSGDGDLADGTIEGRLPRWRRTTGGRTRYTVAAVCIMLVAAGTVFWSGGQRTAARESDKVWLRRVVHAPPAVVEPLWQWPRKEENPALFALDRSSTSAEKCHVVLSKSDGLPVLGLAAGAETSPGSEGLSKQPESAGREGGGQRRNRRERGRIGALRVVLIPRGSYVAIDGQPPVRAPVTFSDLRPGSHQLRLGLNEDSLGPVERVQVKEGELSLVERELANPFLD